MQEYYKTEADFYAESRKTPYKSKVKGIFPKIKTWASDNKVYIIYTSPAVLIFTTSVVKHCVKKKNLKAAKDLKTLFCYDRSLGHYWELTRELTNSEWLSVDSRKRAGEKLGDILHQMKVLK